MEMISFDGAPVMRPITQVAWEFGGIDKGTYAHFTIKEINEQVETIVKSGKDQEKIEQVSELLKSAPFVYFTGSGTSYHCALVAKALLSKYGRRKSDAIMSSEFQYLVNDIEHDSVIVAISQSGEAADVLEVVKSETTRGQDHLHCECSDLILGASERHFYSHELRAGNRSSSTETYLTVDNPLCHN